MGHGCYIHSSRWPTQANPPHIFRMPVKHTWASGAHQDMLRDPGLHRDGLDMRLPDSLRSSPLWKLPCQGTRTHIRLSPRMYPNTVTRWLYLSEPHSTLTCSVLALSTSACSQAGPLRQRCQLSSAS